MQASQNPIKIVKPFGILIAQQVNGVKAGEHVQTEGKKLDNQNSIIFGTSVFASYVAGKNVSIPTDSEDQMIIGYTSQGLPFQIVVNGHSGDTRVIFTFIGEHVMRLMDAYAEKLSKSNNPEEVIKSCIKNIYKLRAQYAPSAGFAMSLGLSYEKDHECYIAGFGIGNTGLVLRKPNGNIQQLAYITAVNMMRCAFDQRSTEAGIDKVINRNKTFNVPIKSGDEIFGYTYLCDDLSVESEVSWEKETFELKPLCGNLVEKLDNIVKYRLDSDHLPSGRESLFEAVKITNQQIFNTSCYNAEKAGKTDKFGDHCMLGSVIIPTSKLQKKLKEAILIQEKHRLIQLLNSQNNEIQKKGHEILKTILTIAKSTDYHYGEKLTRLLVESFVTLISPSEDNIDALLKRAEQLGQPSMKAFGVELSAGTELIKSELNIFSSLNIKPNINLFKSIYDLVKVLETAENAKNYGL